MGPKDRSAPAGGHPDMAVGETLSQLPPRSVAVVLGTRPEIIKLAGIIELLADRAWVISSRQHFDANLSTDFFRELSLRRPDDCLAVGGQSRAAQIAATVSGMERLCERHRPRAVVVQGDTNTAVGGALAANALGIPLFHVEAGLRSFDRRMPEEHNRVVADHLADVCYAPTSQAEVNLLREGIPSERIAVTGNTVIDMVARLLPPPGDRRALLAQMGLSAGSYVVATLHRPENVDDRARLAVIVEQLAALPVPVVVPLHPRTRRRLEEFGLGGLATRLRIVPPLGYASFLGLFAESAFLISDSGGLQEEASYLKRPVLVVRRSTERPEVLGTFASLVPTLDDVLSAALGWLADLPAIHADVSALPCPYGDGRASKRCVDHLLRVLTASSHADNRPDTTGPAPSLRAATGSALP